MKKLFSQKLFSQKLLQKSLLLMVLLTFSSCEIDLQKGFSHTNYDLPEPEQTKTFLDYFEENNEYGIYTYTINEDGDSYLGGYEFIKAGADMVGTFTGDRGNVTVGVNIYTEVITIIGMPFLDLFEENNEYGVYTYNIEDDGVSYLGGYEYQDDGNDDMVGTFTGARGTVTVGADIYTKDITIISMPFLDFFEDGECYHGYDYTIDENGVSYLGAYEYQKDGDDDMTGTFGKITSDSDVTYFDVYYGTKLTVSGNSSSGYISIDDVLYIPEPVTFSYGGKSHLYSYTNDTGTSSTVSFVDNNLGEFSKMTDDGGDSYYWGSRTDTGGQLYFKVDSDDNIYYANTVTVNGTSAGTFTSAGTVTVNTTGTDTVYVTGGLSVYVTGDVDSVSINNGICGATVSVYVDGTSTIYVDSPSTVNVGGTGNVTVYVTSTGSTGFNDSNVAMGNANVNVYHDTSRKGRSWLTMYSGTVKTYTEADNIVLDTMTSFVKENINEIFDNIKSWGKLTTVSKINS